MLITNDNYTVEEVVRANAPAMPGASGDLWGTLELMAKEMDAMRIKIQILEGQTK